MSFIKKQSFGFYAAALAIVAEVIGLSFYFINSGTVTFGNIGLNTVTIAAAIVGIAIELAAIATAQMEHKSELMRTASDICVMLVGPVFTWGVVVFLADRVNAFASVLTFSKSAQGLADMASAVMGLGAMGAAVAFAVLVAFLPIARNVSKAAK